MDPMEESPADAFFTILASSVIEWKRQKRNGAKVVSTKVLM
jgi:hypothetical protein